MTKPVFLVFLAGANSGGLTQLFSVLNQHSGSLWPSSPGAPGPTGSGTHPPSSLGLGLCEQGLPWCALSPVPWMCARRPSKVHTLPGALDLGWMPPTPPRECQAARWREDWSCCFRRIPQTAPKCLFLFEKILLLNPAAPYKEEPVLSHSPPLQLDLELSGSGPDRAQPSTLPSWCPQSLWVYHFILIPLPATSSNQVSLRAAQALFGRGGSSKLQESCCRLGRRGPGAAVALVLHWSQGPLCPEAIPLPSVFFSVLYTFWFPIFTYAGALLAVHFVPQ